MGAWPRPSKEAFRLGLTPGTEVVVVKSSPLGGPLEVQVRGTRLAIGRGMAERIYVRVER